MRKKNKESEVSQGRQGDNEDFRREGLTELIVPSGRKAGDIVTFGGKKYKIVKMMDQLKINGFLSEALGEEVL